MNKQEFVTYMATKYSCTKVKAEQATDMFTSSVIELVGQGNEISLVGFGQFSTSNMAARSGRNPRNGEAVQIKAYTKPKFQAGKKLKDACNK